MERGLVGVLLICLVGSSVPVMLFLGEKARSPITILKVEYPERFSAGVPNRFALNVLARKDVEDLTVNYYYLPRLPAPEMDALYRLEGFNQSVLSDDEPYRFLVVARCMIDLMEGLPGEVSYDAQKGRVAYTYRKDFETRETELTVRFYDLSNSLRWAPASAAPSIYGASTAFALASLPEGNISVYQGVADFYLNRDDSLSDLEYGKDGASSLYLNPKIREIAGEFVHVNDAPAFGTIRFGGVKKGERAYLSFTTRDISLPAVQVVRFWVNGKLSKQDTQFVLLGSPFG